jgi:hypothetical protein
MCGGGGRVRRGEYQKQEIESFGKKNVSYGGD